MLAPKHPNEEERLAALRRYHILDTPAEEDYDDITRLVAHICDTPVALITLIDRDRQFFKSERGAGMRETPRSIALCAHTILGKEFLHVPDVTQDERFADNPLVTGDPNLRFYAGALLQTHDGYPLGTLCVLDFKTRDLTDGQKDALQTLARQVMTMLELRRSLKHERNIAETLQQTMLMRLPSGLFPGLLVETIYAAAQDEAEVGGDFYDAFRLPSGGIALVVGDVAGKGLAAAARTAEVKYALRVYLRESPSPAEAVSRLNRFLAEEPDIEKTRWVGFVTLALAVIHPVGGLTTITLAGAEPPFILRANGAVEIGAAGALPLGISAEAAYQEETLTLAPGDRLVLLTDGITEARRGNEFFGVEGVEETLRNSPTGADVAAVAQSVVSAARAFGGGVLRDDVCLLLAERQ